MLWRGKALQAPGKLECIELCDHRYTAGYRWVLRVPHVFSTDTHTSAHVCMDSSVM